MKNETYKNQLSSLFTTIQLAVIANANGMTAEIAAFIEERVTNHWNSLKAFGCHYGPGEAPDYSKGLNERNYKEDQKRAYLIQIILDGEIAPRFRDPVIVGRII